MSSVSESGSEAETHQTEQQEETTRKRKNAPSGDKEDEEPQKKKKTNENTAETCWELGSNRKVKLNTFKGKQLIDIREYYEDKETGELKPGRKGIALTVDQWDKLKKYIDAIDEALHKSRK
jgi:hypothetical protein